MWIRRQPGTNNNVLEKAISDVLIDVRVVSDEVGLDDVEQAVLIEIADGDPHPALLEPVFVVSHSGLDAEIGERAVPTVQEQDAGGRITCDVYVDPAVAVVVCGDRRERVARVNVQHPSSGSDVGEPGRAVVAV